MLRSENPREASASPMWRTIPLGTMNRSSETSAILRPPLREHQRARVQPGVLALGDPVGARPATQVVAGARGHVGLAHAGAQLGALRLGRRERQCEQPGHSRESERSHDLARLTEPVPSPRRRSATSGKIAVERIAAPTSAAAVELRMCPCSVARW